MRDDKNRGRLNERDFHPLTRSEFDFINSIRQRAFRRQKPEAFNSSRVTRPPSLIYGIGDDAAVFEQRGGFDSVVTADLLVEDIDFRLATTRPRLLGHKALAVSLSDIAAMGARPRFALLSVGIPTAIWRSSFLDRFYEGFFALADRFGVLLIGGDVSRSPDRLLIDSIVIGEAAHGAAIFRCGARPGDHIFVTGSLGGSAVGLQLLEELRASRRTEKRSRLNVERAIRRHRRPEPRLRWGALLGEQGLATSMIDISDGLSSDLRHLCHESGVGAKIDARRIPVDPVAVELADELGLDPLEAALGGGEDFELLFTVGPRALPRLPKSLGGVPATYIGDVTDEHGRVWLRRGRSFGPLSARGFFHF